MEVGADSGPPNEKLVNSHDALVAALRDIARGEGPYSLDPLTHASNTIEAMKEIANNALKTATAATTGEKQ